MPLLAVELRFGNQPFELSPTDADILIRIGGGDRLWQKERLLNVALQHLPPACDKVMWLDCDTVFPNRDWPSRVSRALDRVRMVQVFSELIDVDPCADPGDSSQPLNVTGSALREIAAGRIGRDYFNKTGGREGSGTGATGIGWAFRAEDLADVGLYDGCIVGSGDRAMLSAALGYDDELSRALYFDSARRQHFDSWASRFRRRIGMSFDYLEGRAHHLWHGRFVDRWSSTRHRDLARFRYDPYEDLKIDPSGAWRWCSPKRELHAFVANYFAARLEDAPAEPPSLRTN